MHDSRTSRPLYFNRDLVNGSWMPPSVAGQKPAPKPAPTPALAYTHNSVQLQGTRQAAGAKISTAYKFEKAFVAEHLDICSLLPSRSTGFHCLVFDPLRPVSFYMSMEHGFLVFSLVVNALVCFRCTQTAANQTA